MYKDDVFDIWLHDEATKILDKFILALQAQTNHFYHLDQEIRNDIKELRIEEGKKWDAQDKQWEAQDKKWDANQQELKEIRLEISKLYESINSQTWKMIGSIGLIVILGKLIDDYSFF